MYAIVRIGGHQYRAEPGKTIRVQSLATEPGQTIQFDQVLLIVQQIIEQLRGMDAVVEGLAD